MPDLVLPYMIGNAGDRGSFAYYPSGAIRRIGGTELQRLRDELDVRYLNLSGTDAGYAEKASQAVFGL